MDDKSSRFAAIGSAARRQCRFLSGVLGLSLAIAPVSSSLGETSVPFTALHWYCVSPTGNDANAGTSPSAAWATPHHAVQCGDVIIAAAGSYTRQFDEHLGRGFQMPFDDRRNRRQRRRLISRRCSAPVPISRVARSMAESTRPSASMHRTGPSKGSPRRKAVPGTPRAFRRLPKPAPRSTTSHLSMT